MRRLFVTLQSASVLDELLEARFEEVREPFRLLLYEDGLSALAGDAAAGPGSYEQLLRRGPKGHVPFVPGLGGLVLNTKVQVEHRALRHVRGYMSFSADALTQSAGGVRVAREPEVFLSRYDRIDTFDSDSNVDLTRRVDREGATDWFVSHDESMWHVAASVEPRRRITVRPRTSEAEQLLGLAHIAPRVYAHIYPYGGLSVTLNLSIILRQNSPVSEVLPLLKALIRQRGEPTIDFAMRDSVSGPAHEFIGQVRARVVEAIIPARQTASDVGELSCGLSVSADDDEISDAALSGLLTLDERYERFGPEWLAARASLYGRYRGDRVIATGTTLAVATSPRAFTPGGRRRFWWRCHSLMELARLQQEAIATASQRLARFGMVDGPDERTVRRLSGVCEHLIEFPRGLPAHHRKWFYECQRVLGGTGHVDAYLAAVARMHRIAERAAMLRLVAESAKPNVSLTGSQIGVLNLGSIIGDVHSRIETLTSPDVVRMREALQRLASAAADDPDLSEPQRRELLESVDLLAEEAAKEPERRRAGVVRPVLGSLGALVTTAASLATIWSDVGPELLHFFGL